MPSDLGTHGEDCGWNKWRRWERSLTGMTGMTGIWPAVWAEFLWFIREAKTA